MDSLVGAHVDELSQAGVTTVYYDQALLESFKDNTPLPKEKTTGIDAMEIRHLIYTSGIPPHDLAYVLLLTRHRHHWFAKGRHVRGGTTYEHSTKYSRSLETNRERQDVYLLTALSRRSPRSVYDSYSLCWSVNEAGP